MPCSGAPRTPHAETLDPLMMSLAVISAKMVNHKGFAEIIWTIRGGQTCLAIAEHELELTAT